MSTVAQNWVPLTDGMVSALHAKYLTWIDDLTEIRERVERLRDETRTGWRPPSPLYSTLNLLNREDEHFAARDMDRARCILDAAEADAANSKPLRLDRLKWCKERIARLMAKGWNPTEGLKWPHPMVVDWVGLQGSFSLLCACTPIERIEAAIGRFEELYARMHKEKIKFSVKFGPKLAGRPKRMH